MPGRGSPIELTDVIALRFNGFCSHGAVVRRHRYLAYLPLLQLAAHTSEEIMRVDLDAVELDLQRDNWRPRPIRVALRSHATDARFGFLSHQPRPLPPTHIRDHP
jgi:hypothetical protein